MPVTLFHNPKCSTSRNALALLREKGVEPRVVEYVKTGWNQATLERLAAKTGAGVAGLLRKKEAEAAVLLAAGADDEAIIAAARTHGCALVAMASHGRRGVKALVLGSVTAKVLTHSEIPVLVYRRPAQ